DPARPADIGEGGVLGEKAVAGMDRLAVSHGRRRDDRRDVQIARARVVRPDADRLVGQPHGQRAGVGGRMGDDRAHAQLAARAHAAEAIPARFGDRVLRNHNRGRAPRRGGLGGAYPPPLDNSPRPCPAATPRGDRSSALSESLPPFVLPSYPPRRLRHWDSSSARRMPYTWIIEAATESPLPRRISTVRTEASPPRVTRSSVTQRAMSYP